ncbi:uncharacterized protein LOC110458824 isoform X3 [Mizuhopecten yessoensis]|uniref:uncharacterized protein LOC110458824 isoform X3 n=1 Tax=Mizuhopecten yessoensis TaxID=6573 RepID=UPI000B458840|nr:uncharacterized protein LOC110458824 isoform X3 [Mizuhopecten yessoensis]
MAEDISEDAIDFHNEMVFDLGEGITQKQLFKLKCLFDGNPLSQNDINQIKTIQELFIRLKIEKIISVGDYKKFVPKLKLVNRDLCSIVDTCTNKIKSLRREEDIEGMVISMDETKYHASEGSTAYIDCTVDPKADSITWKKGKKRPLLSTRIPIDNRKYFSGYPKAPTLVIKKSSKSKDEAHYQCSAKAKSKAVDGEIVHLEVSDEGKSNATTTGSTKSYNSPSKSGLSTAVGHEVSQQENDSDNDNESYRRKSHPNLSSSAEGSKADLNNSSISSTGRKRSLSYSTTEMHTRNIGERDNHADQGCQVSLVVRNEIDISREASVDDFSKGFSTITEEYGRVKKVTFEKKCILVRVFITAPRTVSEPSSVHLAEKFRHYILDGGHLRLSDESRTILDIDKDSFKITPTNACHNGLPYVNVSHGMFTVPVGESAILQTYIIAKEEATSIRWFKLKSDQQSAIEIDNKKYFGGSDLSPTLIIRNANIDDQGQYLCWATNKRGTGSSNISFVSIQNGRINGTKRKRTPMTTCHSNKPAVMHGTKPKMICLESEATSGEMPHSTDFTFTTLPEQNFEPITLVKKRHIETVRSPSDITDSGDDYGQPSSSKSSSSARGSPPLKNTDPTAEMHSQYIGTQAVTLEMPIALGKQRRIQTEHSPSDITENSTAECVEETASKSPGDAADENMLFQPKLSGGVISDLTEFGMSNDQGCQTSFVIKNKTDPKRPELVSDISNELAVATNANERVKDITLKPRGISGTKRKTPCHSNQPAGMLGTTPKMIRLESEAGKVPHSPDSTFTAVTELDSDPITLAKPRRIKTSDITDENMPVQPNPSGRDLCASTENLPAICGDEIASKSLHDAADENMPVQPNQSGRDLCDSTENLPAECGDETASIGDSAENLPAVCGDETASKSFDDTADENMPVQPNQSGRDLCDSTEIVRSEHAAKTASKSSSDIEDSNLNRKNMIDVHPKFANMIESTKLMLKEEGNKKLWVDTKGFVEAKKTLLENELHVVIIKGNSGDGKTSIACQLLRELCTCTTEADGKRRRGRQPLELNYIKDLDKLANKSHLAIFLDDLFGKNVVCKEDLKELKKIERHLLSKLRGVEHSEVNFLIITIQSLIFNSVRKHLTGKLFSESSIIDLTSSKYIDFQDKTKLLRRYEPEHKEFEAWKDDEVDKIVKLAPDIGFPQCCRLFRDSPTLQKKRVAFFETPFHFLKSLMTQLTGGHFYGLVYLFLKEGQVTKTDLDPENENRDQTLLDAAFAVDVINVDPTPEVLYKTGTTEYVQKSLEQLVGFLVKNVEVEIRKQDYQEFTRVCAFRFNHDSIEQTVAILYGEKTHVGFIKNCPRTFLSYIATKATNRHTEHSIVLTEEEHTALYSRLLREFDDIRLKYQEVAYSDIWYLYHCITLMDVWADINFMKGFLGWLDDEKRDEKLSKWIRLTLLNKSCSNGANECALYLLQKGATPDARTHSFVIEGDCVDVLKKIDRDLINVTKTDLLNEACSMGSEKCALHLLSESEINNDTPFCVVEGGRSRVLRQMLPDIKEEIRAKETRAPNRLALNINVLHEACLFQREDMVEMLCDRIPNMIFGTTSWGESVFHLVSKTGNCNVFQALEKKMFKYLHFVKDEHQMCDSEGSDTTHKKCAHEQYMCELEDVDGVTVLHQSCISGVKDLCMYLCKCYPALTNVRAADGRHCLHYIAENTSDVALFEEFETYVKQNMESIGQTYDITSIKDNQGQTIFDKTKSNAKRRKRNELKTNPLNDYIADIWPSAATSNDK